jgi:hypothetical protein
MGRRGRAPAVLREIGSARLLCSAFAWLGLNVAAWSRLFEPLPDISAWAWLALAALATLGAGVLSQYGDKGGASRNRTPRGRAGSTRETGRQELQPNPRVSARGQPAERLVEIGMICLAAALPRRRRGHIDQAGDQRRLTRLRPPLPGEHAASDAVQPRLDIRRKLVEPPPRHRERLRYDIVGALGSTTCGVGEDAPAVLREHPLEALGARTLSRLWSPSHTTTMATTGRVLTRLALRRAGFRTWRRSRRPWSRPSRPSAPAPSGVSSTGSCAR